MTFVSIIVVATVVLLLCVALNGLFASMSSIYSPEAMIETVRQHTERVLYASRLYSSTNAAIKTPYGVETCGKWLSDILNTNENHYSIIILGIWGDYASPIPGGTGTTTAAVHIVFPDGAIAEMQYYADTLVLCQLSTDGVF